MMMTKNQNNWQNPSTYDYAFKELATKQPSSKSRAVSLKEDQDAPDSTFSRKQIQEEALNLFLYNYMEQILGNYLLILRISIVTLTEGQIPETHRQVSAQWLHLKFRPVFPLVFLTSVHFPCKHSSGHKLESSVSEN